MLTIQLLDNRLESFNSAYANTNEEIIFSYLLADAEQDALDGSEQFIWDFDAAAAPKDQLVQTLSATSESVRLRFFRAGERTVSLRIERAGQLLYSASTSFSLYEFPVEIEGADFVLADTQNQFRVTSAVAAQAYQWYVNGEARSTTTSVLVDFTRLRKAVIKCRVRNGQQQREYVKTVLVSSGTATQGKRYETNVTPNLCFFNKEGDNLTFDYLPTSNGRGVWDGDMLFDTNSTDTFKTIALYVAEKVAPLAYRDERLRFDKFQLFNEKGLRFQPRYTDKVRVERVEVVSSETDFYSKWLYANNIHLQLPIGSEVLLQDFYAVTTSGDLLVSHAPITDLSVLTPDGGRTFTVIGNKRDAIMVLTDTPNAAFPANYGYGEWKDSNGKLVTVPQGYVSGVNLVSVLDSDQLNADWNEQGFMTLLYDKKKVSVVNSQKNDGLYTVNFFNDDISNRLQTKYRKTTRLPATLINPDFGLRVSLNLKTSKVFLSNSAVDFLPAASQLSMNRKDLLVWQKVGGKEMTPATLRKNSGFTFEQPDADDHLPNLDNIFKTLGVGAAKELLVPQSNEVQDYKLALSSTGTLLGSLLTLILNGKSVYKLIEGVHWAAGSTASETAARLATCLQNTCKGISALAVGREVWLHVQQGYVLDSVIGSTPNATFTAGVLTDNYPTYGIVNDAWALLDASTNGYIHYKQQQDIFYIGYFSGQTPVWIPLAGTKKVVWAEPTNSITLERNVISYAYSLDTTIVLEQAPDATVSGDTLAQKFVDNYQLNLRQYGVDTQLVGSELHFTRLHPLTSVSASADYVSLSAVSSQSITLSEQFTTLDSFMVLEDLVAEEAATQFSELWRRKIIINKIDSVNGFNLNLNGIDLPVRFDDVASNRGAAADTILDVEETLMDWGNQRFQNPEGRADYVQEVGRRYHDVLESMGILVWLEKSLTSYVAGNPHYDTLVIESRFPNVPITYEVGNTFNQHKILHSDVEFFELGASLTVTINQKVYRVPSTGSPAATVLAWVNEYAAALLDYDLVVEAYGAVLRFSTLSESTPLSYQVSVGKTQVSGSFYYSITSWRPGKAGIVISGNEITTQYADFQQLGFATGMIVNVSGCKFLANNTEYNVVLVDADRLGLSYQGAGWDSSDGMEYIAARSGFNWASYDEFQGAEPAALTNHLSLQTRQFIRQPREGYDAKEKTRLSASWLEPSADNAIFFYDFSGKQLLKSVNNEGIYQYQGVSPLHSNDHRVRLNPRPNRDVTKLHAPEYQQTVFDQLVFELDLIDDETNVSPLPSPLQLFVGFNSQYEGVNGRTLLLHRHEDISCAVRTTLNGSDWQDVVRIDAQTQTLHLDRSRINFIDAGFKVGQHIQLSGSDYLSQTNQALFLNSGFEGIIETVNVSSMQLSSLNKPLVDELSYNTSRSLLPPFRVKTSAFELRIVVREELIGRIRLKGETEGEDERLGVILRNLGYDINPKDVFIFKDYDINENGIDWRFMNAKRREMLLVYPEIYNYLSSYKALVNAINFFGYDDLTLNEYYLNVNPNSPQYNKLKKVEIPDIFDSSVEGWNETDYLKETLPNQNFVKTKLFNLTYRITDFDGNNVLGYSLDEVVTKLLGLKRWAKDNVMMLGTNIKDITGVGSTTATTYVSSDVKITRKFHLNESIAPVDFKIESYLQPVENNSRTYMVHLDFFNADPTNKPDYFHLKITTYQKINGKLHTVQLLNEYRTDFKAYNFAADQKIDQYLRIEVSCDNGYGASYLQKRTYSLANGTYIETLL